MWLFEFFQRPKLPDPAPDRALEVAQIQDDALEITHGIREELDRLEATLLRQQRQKAMSTTNTEKRLPG